MTHFDCRTDATDAVAFDQFLAVSPYGFLPLHVFETLDAMRWLAFDLRFQFLRSGICRALHQFRTSFYWVDEL